MDKDYSSDYRQRGRVGDIVVGLDIGTTKVATIVGYLNERGKIEVLGFGKSESKGVEYGLIQNILKTSDSITIRLRVCMPGLLRAISNRRNASTMCFARTITH